MLDARRVEYQVRMSPFEPEWSTTHQRQLRYPTLWPGSYRFEVRARVAAGAWGATTQLAFTVLPAWWQTRWFYAAIGLLTLWFCWKYVPETKGKRLEEIEAEFEARAAAKAPAANPRAYSQET